MVIGLVDIVGVKGPLTREEIMGNLDKHRRTPPQVDDPKRAKWNMAWVLGNARSLPTPVPYKHPKGAQSWIKLEESVRRDIGLQMRA